jgi:hypothetical protein
MAKYFLAVPMMNPMYDPSKPAGEAMAWVIIYETNSMDNVLNRASDLAVAHFPYQLQTSKDLLDFEEKRFMKEAQKMVVEAEQRYQQLQAAVQALGNGHADKQDS